jgi:hypothetical protein
MSEPNNDITNQPNGEPRATDLSNELPVRPDTDYEPREFVLPAPKKTGLWSCVVVAGLVTCVAVAGIGLLIPSLSKVRGDTGGRYQSMNNCKQMVLGMHNCASNSTIGDIPPAYGPFPRGSTTNQSFFVSLLPYIEHQNLYNNQVAYIPVKTYIAPSDPNNPGTSGLISYGSNATLLTVGGNPTLPGSFCGRISNIIVVFERTAKSGATWSSSNSYLIDSGGNSIPEFGPAASWSGYGSRASALTLAGCVVGMGDGSVRVVTQGNANAGWAWAMDPNIPGTTAPLGW